MRQTANRSLRSPKRIVTICSSAYFYKKVIEVADELKNLGFLVKIPDIAKKMGETGDFDVSKVRTWLTNPQDYKIKTKLMKDHFKKVMGADAILTINNEKNGIAGYIGGNALMEMTLAFHYQKPIFIYEPISNDLNIAEEIYGLNPIFINKDLSLIKV